MTSLAPPSPLSTSSCTCTAPNSPGMIPTLSDSRLSLITTLCVCQQKAEDPEELARYYYPPEHVNQENGPKPQGYKCQFCLRTYAKGPSGWSNLYGHCDGSETRPVCPAQHKAAHLKLPPTFKE
ncbi:hypothetical protein DFH28DRAFT_1123198 [Melampsora americana]|nr:hypothetical protein DFH28DRAFT_1123198 [Melampsora americana]